MERRRAEEVLIKKGPWTAEEDEILINFVKKHGPRDWSSIRSKGLLPRSGKSCRLRWVNKLRPNLKIGCKFSAEEERMVIDLQGRFGNKWAAIASYLPGRTDNDVKNFWSTRQKRLARLLKSSSQPSKLQKNKGKAMAVDEMPTLQADEFNSTEVKEESSSFSSSFIGYPEMIKIVPLPDLMDPNMVNTNTSLNVTETIDIKPSISTESSPEFSFTQLPQPKLDLPVLPESLDLVEGLAEPNFLDVFGEASELENVSQLNFGTPIFGLECSFSPQNDGRANNDKLAMLDSFFDDFAVDIFDYLEPVSISSAP